MSRVPGHALLPRSDTSWFTEWRRTLDWGLVAGSVLLLCIGLMMSLAAGPAAAARYGHAEPYFFVYRHAFLACTGLGCLLVVSALDRKWARRLAVLAFALALVMMITVLFAGHEVGGARRWLRFLGLTFQPSEIMKPVLLVTCGWLLAQRELYPAGPWSFIALILFSVTMSLLLLQPDVGQAVLLAVAFVITFFVSGMAKRWMAFFAATGLSLGFILYQLLAYVRVRVNMILSPDTTERFQIDRAAEAFSRGGFFGLGPGEGMVKTRLPDAHTDFILAVMAEEFGLVAIISVMAVYAMIAIRGYRAAARLADGYARAAAAGLVTLLSLQAIINIGVNLAVLPPTGMTLPFISYGGSSMIGTGLTIGLLLALIRGEGTRSQGRYG